MFLGDWFKKEIKEQPAENMVRFVFMLGELPGLFRPTAYMDFDKKCDLFKEKEKFEKLKEEAVEECQHMPLYNKSSGYVISDIPIELIGRLMKTESEFILMNPKVGNKFITKCIDGLVNSEYFSNDIESQLKIKEYFRNKDTLLSFEDCFSIPIEQFINNKDMSDGIKINALFLNYAIKLYTVVNFDEKEFDLIYKVESSDMRITGTGCIEKFVVNFFGEYECTFYKVNTSPTINKEEK